jgi:hypothetical protein
MPLLPPLTNALIVNSPCLFLGAKSPLDDFDQQLPSEGNVLHPAIRDGNSHASI